MPMMGSRGDAPDSLIETLKLLGNPDAYNAKVAEFAAQRAAWAKDLENWSQVGADIEARTKAVTEAESAVAAAKQALAVQVADLPGRTRAITAREQQAERALNDAEAKAAALAKDREGLTAEISARKFDLDAREAAVKAREEAVTKREREAQGMADLYTSKLAALRAVVS